MLSKEKHEYPHNGPQLRTQLGICLNKHLSLPACDHMYLHVQISIISSMYMYTKKITHHRDLKVFHKSGEGIYQLFGGHFEKLSHSGEYA